MKGATFFWFTVGVPLQFQSTLPVKGATAGRERSGSCLSISIHAPREGSDSTEKKLQNIILISIHAPREGSDSTNFWGSSRNKISIHAPREGSDRTARGAPLSGKLFQSTLPVKGATPEFDECQEVEWYFNPRSPWRERHDYMDLCLHLLQFQSTLPVKGATAMLTNFSVTIVQLSANSTNFSL